jgi:hypothetical protein
MKKNFVATAIAIMFALTITASAQKAPADFSGKWTLDMSKSKVSDNEKAAIESQTLTVTQSAADFKVETTTKRIAPAGAPADGAGRMGPGSMTNTFPFGKEATVEQQRGQMTIPVTYGSKWDGSKVVTWNSFTMNGPNGEMKNSTKETWELGADGKTLTVTRESNGRGGPMTTTRVYTKS